MPAPAPRARHLGPHGILLIDKEPGWTSHDAVAKSRRLTGQRKIGHTGTLDPLATGLLVLCLGRATRLVEYMTAHAKRYEGEAVLGAVTTTDDAEGEVIESRPIPGIEPARLRELERHCTGAILQRPPAYSAVKVGGQRAYAVARKGGTPELAERPVTIHELQLELTAPGRLSLRVHCGPGTYIRSLVRDIGAELGCGAYLAALRRTAVDRFRIEDAVTLGQLAEAAERGALDELLWAPDEGIAGCDAAIVTRAHADLLCHGGVLEPGPRCERESSVARVYTTGGEFVAVGRVDGEGRLRPLKVLGE